jgi:hypothetical protein
MTPEWAMLGDQGLRKSATARQATEAVAERMNKKRFIQTLQLKVVLCSHNTTKLMSSRPSRSSR